MKRCLLTSDWEVRTDQTKIYIKIQFGEPVNLWGLEEHGLGLAYGSIVANFPVTYTSLGLTRMGRWEMKTSHTYVQKIGDWMEDSLAY